jgi:methylamine dehydrogenase accessory protein MauD
MRVAPAGALTTAGGPAVGSGSPVIEANDINGRHVHIGGPAKDKPLRLLMFVSAMCPLCKGLIPVAKSFARMSVSIWPLSVTMMWRSSAS